MAATGRKNRSHLARHRIRAVRPARRSSTSAKLRLLVVGDSPLAQKITRLRGEWSARSGGSLEVSEMSPADLAKAKSLAADVVIYPSAEWARSSNSG